MRSTTFITLLTFISFSLGLPSIPQARTITVPMIRSNNPLVDEGGVVAFDALQNHAQRVSKRYNHDPLSKRGKLAVAHVDYLGGSHWQANISVGSPAQTYSVALDTGSTDLYLPHAKCTTCRQHKGYDDSASCTSVALNRNFTIEYADGTLVQGDLYKDIVRFGGAKVRNQTFGAATYYRTNFDLPSDGLLGLSFPAVSGFGANPLLESLAQGGLIDRPMFGAKLSQQGSEITLGGVNPKIYKGDVHTNNVTSPHYWQVQLDAFNINGQPVLKSISTILDTGASLIIGDAEAVENFYRNIPGSAMEPNYQGLAQGIYSVPCDSPPTFSLTFGGKEFALPTDAFFIGNDSRGKCIGGVTSAFPVWGGWVIGSNFLETVYSVFDMSSVPMTVGFAELA